jgi:hypothetical protein
MQKPRVYVETTIPSFYYETRTQPNLVAWRDLTREWWSDAAEQYELVTSFTVFVELSRGRSADLVRLRMELLSGIPLLLSNWKISEIVQMYLRLSASQAHAFQTCTGRRDAPGPCFTSRL